MPFREEWLNGNSIFIIDPWSWLALGIGVFLSRRRTRTRNRSAPRPSLVALAVVSIYIVLMLLGSRHAHVAATRHMIAVENRASERVMAGPVPLNPLRRELIYAMGEHYRFGSLAWLPQSEITLEPAKLPTNLDHPAVQARRDHPEVQGFLDWSRFPLFTIEEEADAARVHLGDARFARRAGGWNTVSVRVPFAATP